MKVNVRFGAVIVVVPCGHGDLSVRQLIIEAIVRYRKATNKPPDSWVLVHSLQGAGGGILDPDDRLSDVVDDREQIIACYEEEGGGGGGGGSGHLIHHNVGDGTSASSSPSSSASPTHSPAFQNHKHGNGLVNGLSSAKHVSRSPEIFQGMEHQFHPFSRNGIEITGEELQRRGNAGGLTVIDASVGGGALQVRRGSEPSLNCLGGPGDLMGVHHGAQPGDRVTVNGGSGSGPGPPGLHVPENKRWSAAPIIDDDDDSRLLKVPEEALSARDDGGSSDGSGAGGSSCGGSSGGGHRSGSKSPFSRGIGGGDLNRRSRDATRLSMQVGSFAGDLILSRWLDKDGVGGGIDGPRREPLGSSLSPDHSDSERDREEVTILIRPEGEPLGLHVVPDYDPDTGAERGLLVQRLEPDSRAHRDGQLHVGDRIVEINGQHLIGMPFSRAHELFREAMESPDILLRVVKASSGQHFEEMKDGDSPIWSKEDLKDELKPTSAAGVGPGSKKNMILPNRASTVIMSANTRKIGKILSIDLVKGPQGLGFSLTTRDNPAGGSAPIYVKNILPKGAAIEDGRLKPGDRLLEVNGTDMNGKSQSDAVNILRNVAPGSKVTLTVSRQEIKEEKNLSPKLPRELPSDKAEEEAAAKQREIMTLDIPVHDSERAGLGVSVKGKASNSNDLGIFVKSVIHGGAASKDGRLMPNDQLLNINGISLLNMSNSDAMETLRKAMCQEGPTPGILTLTIARRRPSPGDDSRSSPGSQSSGRNMGNSSLSGSAETLDDGSFGRNALGGNLGSDTPDSGPSGLVSSNGVGGRSHAPPLPLKKHHGIEDRDLGFDVLPMRNPVIDRITGQNSLRNDSYCKATHDASWSPGGATSSHLSYFMSGKRGGEEDIGSEQQHGRVMNGVRPGGTIISQSNQETVMIEDEYVPPLPHRDCTSSTVGTDSRRTSNNSDVAYASQTSLEDNPTGFSRDQFGRQSMSEKGHATLDAKNTDTYQRNKRIREERLRMQQLQAVEAKKSRNVPGKDVGPGLGMKKSSSLESLQTMVQELSQAEDGDPALSYRPNPVRVVRGRGCNESFRAAVDRSYDAPLVEHGRPGDPSQMEAAVSEEEGSQTNNGPHYNGHHHHHHHHKHPNHPHHHHQQQQHQQQQQQQKEQQPPPLNPRASHQPPPPSSSSQNGKADRTDQQQQHGGGLSRGTNLQSSMPERISQQQPAAVVHVRSQSSTHPQPHKTPPDQLQQRRHTEAAPSPIPPAASPTKAPKDKKKGSFFKGLGTMFRFGKHRDLRELEAPPVKEDKVKPASNTLGKPGSALAQRQREERRAFAREEAARMQMDQRQRNEMMNQQNVQNGVPPPPQRTQRLDANANQFDDRRGMNGGDYLSGYSGNYEDMSRPGCRSGFVDPSRYSHYENYSEIQLHMRRQQQVYHSQRRGRGNAGDGSRERPKSNFYEYESVAALVRPATALGAPSTTAHLQQQQQSQHTHSPQPSSVRSRRGPAIHNSLPKKSQHRNQHPSIESAFPQQKVPHQGPYRNNNNNGGNLQTNGLPQNDYACNQPQAQQQPPPPPHATRAGGGGPPPVNGVGMTPPYAAAPQQQQVAAQHLYQQHPQPLQTHKHPAQRSAMMQQQQQQQQMTMPSIKHPHIPGGMGSSSLHRIPNARPNLPPPEFFDPRRSRTGPAPGHGSRVHPGFDAHQPQPAAFAAGGPPGPGGGGSGGGGHHFNGVHQYNGGAGLKHPAPQPPPPHHHHHHYPQQMQHPRQQATQS